MQIPIDPRIVEITDIPYTLSFLIRKRLQVDNLNELPKEKRPTEQMIWHGAPEEIDDWLDKVHRPAGSKNQDSNIIITDVEG